MPALLPLFRRIAGAAVKVGLKGVLGMVPFGEVAYDVAVEVCGGGKEPKANDKARAVAQEAARASPDEIDRAAAAVADEVAAGQAQEVREQVRAGLTNLLMQVPAGVRTASRSAEDPTGMTVALDFFLSPDKVVQALPARLPRFKAGDYPLQNVDRQLVRLLGFGGFGEVWLARKTSRKNAEPVAMKFCLDEKAQERLLAHEKAINDLVDAQDRNRGVVPLLETYLRASPPALEYKYVPGGDLSRFVLEWQRLASKERVARAARTMLELARTTGSFHALAPAVVHRDLKPSNILIETIGGVERLRIADFGIGGLAAQQALREAATRPPTHTAILVSELRGAHTPLYASPQQKEGDAPDPRDDIHALGVIWYQLLTGSLRCGPPTGRMWVKKLQADGMRSSLIELLSACVEPIAADRVKDGQELARELAKAFKPRQAGGGQITPTPATPRESMPLHGETVPKPPEHPLQTPGDTLDLGSGVSMRFAWVPPGTFWMGGGEGTPGDKQVEIAAGFGLGIYPVTQEQWQAVMGCNPSYFSRTSGGKDKVQGIGDAELRQFPVETVSWEDAQQLLARLNEKKCDTGWLYRLPTEAEWEYACRGGASSQADCAFSFYLDRPTNALSSAQANLNRNHPTKVGSYKPNRLGLYDMHGNVWEWCQDWYEEGSSRVLRGGGWCFHGSYCQAALRSRDAPSAHRYDVGLRLARVPSRE
jgi:formylglycine-generating enzyme required for sulfatase activity